MSTEFRSQEHGFWVCTRWASKSHGGAALDFGSERRFRDWEVVGLNILLGEVWDVTLVSEVGEEVSLLHLLLTHPVTFGEFVGTVEVGSGELLERTGEDEA